MYICLFYVIVTIGQTNVITGQGEDRSRLDLEARVIALENALSTLKTELDSKVASLKCDCSSVGSGLGTLTHQTGKRLLGESFTESWGVLDSIWGLFVVKISVIAHISFHSGFEIILIRFYFIK